MNKEEYLKELENIGRSYSNESIRTLLSLEPHVNQFKDKELLLNHKLIIIMHAVMVGEIDIAMANFSWYLKNPPNTLTVMQTKYVCFSYKSIIKACIKMTYFTNEKINVLLDNFLSFLKKYNLSLEPYYKLKYFSSLYKCEISKLEKNFIQWREQKPMRNYSDCTACSHSDVIIYHALAGDMVKVKEEIIPIDEGKMKCYEIPDILYPELSFLLAIAGQYQDSSKYYKLGKELITDIKGDLQQIAYSILSSAIHELENTNTLVDRYSHLELEAKIHYDLLVYYVAMAIYLQRLSTIKTAVNLKLPKVHPMYDESDLYDCHSLLEFYQDKAHTMMKAFDQRNGNDNVSKYYTELIETVKEIPVIAVE